MLKLPCTRSGGMSLNTNFMLVLLGWVGQANLAWVDPGLRTTCPMHIPYFKS